MLSVIWLGGGGLKPIKPSPWLRHWQSQQAYVLAPQTKYQTVPSLGGARGAVSHLTAACAPRFGLLKILFLEHHATTRQWHWRKMRVITFEHNSLLTFSRFFAKLLATKCCTWMMNLHNIPSYYHTFTAELRNRDVSLQSLPILRWWLWHETIRENIFFKDQLFWFLEHTQDFEVAVSSATRVKGFSSLS